MVRDDLVAMLREGPAVAWVRQGGRVVEAKSAASLPAHWFAVSMRAPLADALEYHARMRPIDAEIATRGASELRRGLLVPVLYPLDSLM